jgi:hypothetical protein
MLVLTLLVRMGSWGEEMGSILPWHLLTGASVARSMLGTCVRYSVHHHQLRRMPPYYLLSSYQTRSMESAPLVHWYLACWSPFCCWASEGWWDGWTPRTVISGLLSMLEYLGYGM